MSYTVILDPGDGAPDLVGTEVNVYLKSRLPRFNDGEEETEDIYEGAETQIREMYEDYIVLPAARSVAMSKGDGGKYTLTVVWSVSLGEDEEPPGEDEADASAVWDMQPIEIVIPVAAHPYFQVAYVGGSGEFIEDRIAEADHALATGQAFIADGDYKEWVKRYYGLRVAGVNGYQAMGVSLTKTYRINDMAPVRDYAATTAHVFTTIQMALLGVPADMMDVLDSFKAITSYGSSNPDSWVETANQWEFLQKPPTIQGPNEGPWDVRFEWLGLHEWSKVLYADGSWDPQGDTT